jgi:predicted nucleotidyltransferase
MGLPKDTSPIQKRTEVFNSPNPFDLVTLTATFDDQGIQPPPETYYPPYDILEQLADITQRLKVTYGDHLDFVGLTGSRANGLNRPDSDLDVIAIIDDEVTPEKLSFHGDLKLVSRTGLREFIEHGYQLVSTQFRKAIPLYDVPERSAIFRSYQVIPDKAIPFLHTKSKFNLQTAEIYHLMSNKYRAISFYKNGDEERAFSQLKDADQDGAFTRLRADESHPDYVYVRLAVYYANLGLNRLFHSLSEALQIHHIIECGDVADVEVLLEWALNKFPGDIGPIYRQVYQTRIECYKNGRLLQDTEVKVLTELVQKSNEELEKMRR